MMGRRPDDPNMSLRGYRYVSMPSRKMRVDGVVVGVHAKMAPGSYGRRREATVAFIEEVMEARVSTDSIHKGMD